jgi:hypothetical protein
MQTFDLLQRNVSAMLKQSNDKPRTTSFIDAKAKVENELAVLKIFRAVSRQDFFSTFSYSGNYILTTELSVAFQNSLVGGVNVTAMKHDVSYTQSGK